MLACEYPLFGCIETFGDRPNAVFEFMYLATTYSEMKRSGIELRRA